MDIAPELPDASDPLREQLLDAAARVFAEKGYSGTKIMDVVKASGLSSGAVYGRFESKDELLIEAVVRKVQQTSAARQFAGRTVAEILVEATRANGSLTDAEATQVEAFIAARRQPQVADAIARSRATWRSTIVTDLVRRAIEDGSADPDADFASIVYFMESLNLGLLVQRGAGQEAPDRERWARFMRGIIGSMARVDEPASSGGQRDVTQTELDRSGS